MTKHNLTDTTFIIPVKIESDDRLRNAITVCCFLLSKFDTNILVKEVNNEPVFENEALPQIKEFIGNTSNISYYFEKESDNTFFHKTRYFNELLNECNTDVVSAYDIDVLLPVSTYLKAEKMCKDEYDLVYPYGQGMWQKQIFADDELVSDFLSNDCKFDILERQSKDYDAQSGHVQFFKTKSYIEGGMENENFKSWGPEDAERLYRFTALGYNVCRINDWVYHLEHARGEYSWYNNPHMQNNTNLWESLQRMNKDQLKQYYTNQDYLKKYK